MKGFVLKKSIKLLIIILIGYINLNQATMQVSEFYNELYPQDPVPTEYSAYKALLNNPLEKNINYLAIPWVQLIKNLDKYKEALAKIKLNGGFTICQHFQYEKILPILKEIGIDTLFASNAEKEDLDIKVLPFPHYPITGADPKNEKDIWYSFIGSKTHKVREKLFLMKHPENSVVIRRKGWLIWQTAAEREEYKDVLARSRFSLCPRGHGASTIRFWESLQAGAIPVLIADDMKLLPNILVLVHC